MPTKYERIYSQLKVEIDEIRRAYSYDNDSAAFGHIMIRALLDVTDEEANEAMTDGSNDNGLDAVYIDDRGSKPVCHFFQFKFPGSSSTIDKAVTQDEILKVCNGFEHFIGNDEKFNSLQWNELLIDKRAELMNCPETDNDVIHIVRFTSCEMNDNLVVLDSKIRSLKERSGNNISKEVLLASGISELYERTRLNTWPDFSIKYKKDLSPFEDSSARVMSYYVSLFDIYKAVRELSGNVYEGNVRYFDNSSKVNSGIIETLRSNECVKFHLLNNGITIVCSDCSINSPTDTINIKKGSIINGGQTVGCILKVINEYIANGQDTEVFEKSFVFVRVIKIENKQELVEQLVYTLNTQNQMRSSYSISNDAQIKAIQKEINSSTKYFLQIKNNEFNFQKNQQPQFGKLVRDIIDIETAIQAFVAFENISDLGYLSKGSKAALFDDENRQLIINEITADKLLKSYEQYLVITEITRQYRAYRKDSSKTLVLRELKIEEKEINKYRFINTGNYLILYSLGIYCRKSNAEPTKELIIGVIRSLSSLFKNNNNVSNLTKAKDTFENAKRLFEKKSFQLDLGDQNNE